MRMQRGLAWAVLAATLVTSPLLAQPSGSNKAAAEALFREGKKLMGEKKFGEACPKFADSQRLDPGAGTLLNLAFCYEANGQLATAWATYQDAGAAAKAEQNTNYMSTAEKRGTALESKLPKLTITIATPVDGMEIRRDNVVVSKAEWGLEIPVDPGSHSISASAPKKKPWSTSVDAVVSGKVNVPIPALEDAPEPPQPPTSATVTPTASISVTAVPTAPPPSPSPVQKIVGWTTVAVGVVGLGIGAGFAFHAKSQYNDSLGPGNANCPVDPNKCNATGVSLRNDAISSGNAASVLLGVGAAAVVGGVLLVLTAPSAAAPPAKGQIRVLPTLGGALVQGAF